MRFLLFLLLIGCAIILRTYDLSSVPPFLLEREIRVGLLAQTLLHANWSMYYSFFFNNIGPINTTYIAPFLILVTFPFIKIFGLHELAVRLPGAISGTATVLLFYFLVKEIDLILKKNMKNTYSQSIRSFVLSVPLLAMVVMVFSPWHIQVSRVDGGVSLGLFFFLLGIYCLLIFRKSPWLFYFWLLPFIGAIYSDYQFFIPSVVVIIGAGTVQKNLFKKKFPLIMISVGVAVICLLPIFSHVTKSVLARDDFSSYQLSYNEQIAANRISYRNTKLTKILLNNNIENVKLFAFHITEYLEPHTLFFQWNYDKDYISPFSGLFYPIDVVFLLAGGLFFIRKNRSFFILLMLYIAVIIIPLALLKGSPTGLGAVGILPALIIILVYGFLVLQGMVGKRWRGIFILVVSLLFVYFVARFLYIYFILYKQTTGDYQKEYQKAFSYTANHTFSTRDIIVTDATFGKNTSLYFLFGANTSSALVTASKTNVISAIAGGGKKYTFIFYPPAKYNTKKIYMQPAETLPKKNVRILFTSNGLNDRYKIVVFEIVKPLLR